MRKLQYLSLGYFKRKFLVLWNRRIFDINPKGNIPEMRRTDFHIL